MTKKQMIESIAKEAGLTKKHAGQILELFTDGIRTELASSGRFAWPGLGVWTVRSRKARAIANPQTGERMELPKSWVAAFRQAKELAQIVRASRERRAA